jgi:hypothetical protein
MRAIGSRANSLFETTPGAHHIENILADDIAASCNLKQRGDLMRPYTRPPRLYVRRACTPACVRPVSRQRYSYQLPSVYAAGFSSLTGVVLVNRRPSHATHVEPLAKSRCCSLSLACQHLLELLQHTVYTSIDCPL